MSKHSDELEKLCKKAIEHLKTEMSKLRGGRASTSLLETIHASYYGSMVPLQQLGLISAPEPRLLTVQVYDSNAVESVEKAIQSSGLGLNPMREGSLVRISIPALTDERRKELIKNLHKMSEETKVVIRNSRRDVLDLLKKEKDAGGVSEDDMKRGQDEIQKVTDKNVKLVDEVLALKEKEMLAA